MSDSVIRLSGFYYAYPQSDVLLKDINLSVEKGSFTAIAGPSGAGKTTLCRAMTGIVPTYYGGRYAGAVEVLGEDIRDKKISDLAMRVGIMLDDYESQMVSLTAGEEISFSLLNHGFSPDEVDARVKEALNASDCRTGKTTSLMSCRADSGSACFWPPSLRHVLISLSLMNRFRPWT